MQHLWHLYNIEYRYGSARQSRTVSQTIEIPRDLGTKLVPRLFMNYYDCYIALPTAVMMVLVPRSSPAGFTTAVAEYAAE